jgi:hypothetical protein
MSSVGSYLQSARRGPTTPGDLGWLCSYILKLLGEEPRSFGALLSLTRVSENDLARAEADLRGALALLQNDGLVAGNDGRFFLTDSGRRALYVVA